MPTVIMKQQDLAGYIYEFLINPYIVSNHMCQFQFILHFVEVYQANDFMNIV